MGAMHLIPADSAVCVASEGKLFGEEGGVAGGIAGWTPLWNHRLYKHQGLVVFANDDHGGVHQSTAQSARTRQQRVKGVPIQVMENQTDGVATLAFSAFFWRKLRRKDLDPPHGLAARRSAASPRRAFSGADVLKFRYYLVLYQLGATTFC